MPPFVLGNFERLQEIYVIHCQRCSPFGETGGVGSRIETREQKPDRAALHATNSERPSAESGVRRISFCWASWSSCEVVDIRSFEIAFDAK